MFTHFNFWYLFAPLGAFVAAYIGYKRSHRNGKHYERLDARSAWLDIVVASVASTILCALFYIESHRGLVEFFIGNGEDGLGAVCGAVCVVVVPPIVAAIYGRALWSLAQRFAKIGVRRFYCRATLRRNRNGEIRYVINMADLAKAIAATIAKDHRTRRILEGRFRRAQLRRARSAQSGDPKQPKTAPTSQATQATGTSRYAESNHPEMVTEPISMDITAMPCATRPAPSKKLVTTTLYGPDGSTRQIEVPEDRVADLQVAMLRYRNALARAQAIISSALSEADTVKRQQACLERRAEFDRAVGKLDPDDQKLIRQMLIQYPLLGQIIESENLHIRIRLVGTGKERQVRFYSMRFCAAS